MNIFVTGGTGYIGSVLIKEAIALDHQVTVLTRSQDNAKELQALGVKTIVGDMLEDGEWQRVLNETDATIHLAAPPTWGKKVTKDVANTYADLHSQLTKRLFESMDLQAFKKCIFVGGTSYFGDSGNGKAQDETYSSTPKGWGPYIAASIELAKQYSEKGYPVTVVYPAQIYGPTSWMEQLFLQPLYTQKPLTGLKGYDAYFSPIHIEDCGRALLHLIEHGQNGEDYIISDQSPIPSSIFRDEIIRLMDAQNVKIRRFPRWLCQLAIGPVLTEYATAHTNFSSQKLVATGFEYRYPDYKEGLPQVVEEWLAKQG